MIASRCAWAACHAPAAETVNGWLMCAPHVAEHHALTGSAQRGRDGRIVEMHAAGLNDAEIARELKVAHWVVRHRRRSLGLRGSERGRPVSQPCGTPAAYERHLRHGEPTCAPCRAAHALDKASRRSA